MSDYLILPVEGKIIRGNCIDGDGTNVREDMVRISYRGNLTQIDIACLVPPVRNISIDELHASLMQQLSNTLYRTDQKFKPFISLPQKKILSFNDSSPRQALVATYIINGRNEILVEELSISEAVGELIYFSEFDQLSVGQEIVEVLKRLIHTDKEMITVVQEGSQRYYFESLKFGFQTTFMCSTLFNRMCRNASKGKGVPYISKQYGEHRFNLNSGNPKFNCCLRDPHAYVNASNLMSYFSNKELFFSNEYLQKTLPIAEVQNQ